MTPGPRNLRGDMRVRLGQAVREAMTRERVTSVAQLADALKIRQQSLSNWTKADRTDVPDLDRLPEIAAALKVDWQWLLIGDWSARPQEVSARDLPPTGVPCEHEIEAATMNKDDRDAWDLFVEFAKNRKGKREKEWGLVSRFVVFIADLTAGQARQGEEKKPDAPKRRAAL